MRFRLIMEMEYSGLEEQDEELVQAHLAAVAATLGEERTLLPSIPGAEIAKGAFALQRLEDPEDVQVKRRCPHDGGTCHHDCEGDTCYREEGGMSLSTPHEGYPKPKER